MVAPLPNSCGIEPEGELFRVHVSDSAQPLKRFITGRILIRRTDRGNARVRDWKGRALPAFPNSSAEDAIGLS
jgi:hypothetical protein